MRWNFHELNLIDNGNRALMVTSQNFSAIEIDVPQYNGSCRIAKQGFKEVDVKTGEIYFEWHTLGHIRAEESVYVGDDVPNNTWRDKCEQNWGKSVRPKRLRESKRNLTPNCAQILPILMQSTSLRTGTT